MSTTPTMARAATAAPVRRPVRNRYVFSVYALDAPLDLPEGATGALVRFVLRRHTRAYGRLVGTYGR